MATRLASVAATICLGLLPCACAGAETAAQNSGRACRATTAAPDKKRAITTAQPLVRRLAAGLRAPGTGVAVAVRGRLVWVVNCGYANVASRRPVTAGTIFRIGSVTKTLTAAALMRLAADGEVDLDAPIKRYLPSFPHGGEMTLRQLAGHLAGIRHYETPAEAVNTRHFASVTASLSVFAHDHLVAPPGTQFAYSSYGFDVIGAALEQRTHTPFPRLIRRLVFARAHMANTTLAVAPESKSATFYEVTNSGGIRLAPRIDLSDRLPAGGMLSTASDLARFGSALVSGRLVPRRSLAEMFTSQKTKDGRQTDYGIGFELHSSPYGVFVGHTGAVDGGTAVLLIHPRTQTVLALATNLGYATAESPPQPAASTPDPPTIMLPFIKS